MTKQVKLENLNYVKYVKGEILYSCLKGHTNEQNIDV